MTQRIIVRYAPSLLVCTLVAACGPAEEVVEEGTDAEDLGEVAVTDDAGDDAVKADSARTFVLEAAKSVKFTFTEPAGALIVTVDCTPPAGADDLGPVFAVAAPDLGIAKTTSEPARAGYWRWAGTLTSGAHAITVANRGARATCKGIVARNKSTSSCKAWTTWRSPNLNHAHFRVGTDTSADWEPFPASGNHWGAWAPWNKAYPKPMKRAFLLHNLEHGGTVFSYKCTANTCPDAATMVAFANGTGETRIIVTPDSTQPKRFAARSWRWAYQSDCLDKTSMTAFVRATIRHGREDIDADPPIEFDPTTTNVPCQDLMAAPDSCN